MIDQETLGDELEFEDGNGVCMSYGDMKCCCAFLDTEMVELLDDDVDEADVLLAEIEELEEQISWNDVALEKRKAFLESLAGGREAA